MKIFYSLAITMFIFKISSPEILAQNNNLNSTTLLEPRHENNRTVVVDKIIPSEGLLKEALQLDDFVVKGGPEGVEVLWAVETRYNNVTYVIQKSFDGKVFADLSLIHAKHIGTSSYKKMDFTDAADALYRIKLYEGCCACYKKELTEMKED